MATQKKAKDATKKTAACGGGDGEEVPIRVVKGEERDTDTAERAEKTAKKRDSKGRFVKQNAEPPNENSGAADECAPDDGSPTGEADNSHKDADGNGKDALPVFLVSIIDSPFGRLAVVKEEDGERPPIVYLDGNPIDMANAYMVCKLLDSAACVATKYKRKAKWMTAVAIGAVAAWMGSVAALLGVILAK